MSRASRLPGRPVARSVGLVGLALAGLVLSGCGARPASIPARPLVVGDESLSMSKIDTTTPALLPRPTTPQITQPSQRVPMRFLRQFVAASLSQRLLGEQLAEEYDVQPTSQYAQQVTKVSQPFASAAPELRDAVVDVEAGGPYLQTVQVAIGEKLLAEAGQPAHQRQGGAPARPGRDRGLAEGPLDQHRPGLRRRGRRRAVQGRARPDVVPAEHAGVAGRGELGRSPTPPTPPRCRPRRSAADDGPHDGASRCSTSSTTCGGCVATAPGSASRPIARSRATSRRRPPRRSRRSTPATPTTSARSSATCCSRSTSTP